MPLYLVFYFWVLVISALVCVLERFFPRQKGQEILRPEFVQDLFWMVFNTQYVAWMLAIVTASAVAALNSAFLHFDVQPSSLRLISHWPLWAQFAVFFLAKDFIEWNVHLALHRVPWLWRFHQLHHSARHLDWAVAFRSHWGELLIYKLLVYLPLVVLGVDDRVVFAILVCSLLIQEISHANLKWDWGPLRWLINSPRFHSWHHDVELHGRAGQNFGVNLVVWDWLFGTAHWPGRHESPATYGFAGIERYPTGIWSRLWRPFRLTEVAPDGRTPANENGDGHPHR
jgi:sterol desaturase/sphingolipid hydroxylase (fatty acid hydroxylase superfamily)